MVDVFDAKADAEAVLAALGAPARDADHPQGRRLVAPRPLGRDRPWARTRWPPSARFTPASCRRMDVKGPAVAFTILVANVPAPKVKTPTRPALAISDLQAVDRDFAFVVDATVEALTAVNAALGADKALIESVRVFDQFTGDKAEAQMGAGKKSIALTVRLQPTPTRP